MWYIGFTYLISYKLTNISISFFNIIGNTLIILFHKMCSV